MLRLLLAFYGSGIVLFLVFVAIWAPRTPLIDAIVAALLWPWSLYRFFVGAGLT